MNQQRRREELTNALRKRGLPLRKDSQLCNEYIEGKGDQTVDKIVETMEEMKFFHESTKYRQYYEQMEDEYKLSGKYDPHVLSCKAKESALILYVHERMDLDESSLLKNVPLSLTEKLLELRQRSTSA